MTCARAREIFRNAGWVVALKPCRPGWVSMKYPYLTVEQALRAKAAAFLEKAQRYEAEGKPQSWVDDCKAKASKKLEQARKWDEIFSFDR